MYWERGTGGRDWRPDQWRPHLEVPATTVFLTNEMGTAFFVARGGGGVLELQKGDVVSQQKVGFCWSAPPSMPRACRGTTFWPTSAVHRGVWRVSLGGCDPTSPNWAPFSLTYDYRTTMRADAVPLSPVVSSSGTRYDMIGSPSDAAAPPALRWEHIRRRVPTRHFNSTAVLSSPMRKHL